MDPRRHAGGRRVGPIDDEVGQPQGPQDHHPGQEEGQQCFPQEARGSGTRFGSLRGQGVLAEIHGLVVFLGICRHPSLLPRGHRLQSLDDLLALRRRTSGSPPPTPTRSGGSPRRHGPECWQRSPDSRLVTPGCSRPSRRTAARSHAGTSPSCTGPDCPRPGRWRGRVDRGRKRRCHPARACAARAWATTSAWVRCERTLWTEMHQSGRHGHGEQGHPTPGVEQRGRAQCDDQQEGQEDHGRRSARRRRSRSTGLRRWPRRGCR